MTKVSYILPIAIMAMVTVFYTCTKENSSPKTRQYLNLDPTVKYVGKQKCIQCHSDVWHTFQHTGMGLSFGEATKSKSKANYHHSQNTVYDSSLNLYYQSSWKQDTLVFTEFRLFEGDTIHKRQEQIDYIIGSGQHTNSHLLEVEGFLYQAPITFYTQKGLWDLAPGFENGYNTRFSRYIGKECMTCHNALPTMDSNALHLYDKIPLGIDCERCHGPGQLHVQNMIAEKIIDTSKYVDYSIVNPSDLAMDYQNSLCQRCHLQGVSVLKEGKDFDDFRPGMLLEEIMDVYMPSFSKQNDLIMASHVERLKMSKCFKSNQLSCISCHNPHISVKDTDEKSYNKTCQSCHSNYSSNHENLEISTIQSQDCISCHMTQSGSIDIPHVAVTDHYIRIPSKQEDKSKKFFQGLVCINNASADNLSKVKAYLAYYQKYDKQSYVLDSLEVLIESIEDLSVQIEYLFLTKDYESIVLLHEKSMKEKYNHWTNYRIAESYFALGAFNRALIYFRQALALLPKHIDYVNKVALTYFKLGNNIDAEKNYRYSLSLNSSDVIANCNLGYIEMMKGNLLAAETLLQRSIKLDPDYRLAWENLLQVRYRLYGKYKALDTADEFLKHHPDDIKMKKIKQKING